MDHSAMLSAPPTEENSLLLQITVGCSWNQCTFCEMYKDKIFRVRSFEEIADDLSKVSPYEHRITQVFLCDGDAVAAPTSLLLQVLIELMRTFPNLHSVSAYASARSINQKEPREWEALAITGLNKVYLGLESGSNTILSQVRKGSNQREMLKAAKALNGVGITLVVTAILGLGGQALMEEHIKETADALNKMCPDYLGIMTLHKGETMDTSVITPAQILNEMWLLLMRLELDQCVFSSGHVSNPLHMEGRLPEQRDILIRQIEKRLS